MGGYLKRDKDGNLIEVFCPYSENGKCKACKQLSINCNGENYYNCEQYKCAKE